jgi:hypothetical protein
MILSLALPRASSRPYDLSPTVAAVRHKQLEMWNPTVVLQITAASRAPAHAVYGLYLDLDFQTRRCYSNTLQWDSVQSCDVQFRGGNSPATHVLVALRSCATSAGGFGVDEARVLMHLPGDLRDTVAC